MLPFLEQQALYSSLSAPNHGPAVDAAVEVFVCPSDPESLVAEGNFNYLFNGGSRVSPTAATASQDCLDDGLKPRDVTDGMSNTALLAERLFSIGKQQYRGLMQNLPDRDDRRYTWYLPRRVGSTPDEAEFVDLCRDERVGVLGPMNAYGTPFGTLAQPYTHVLPPNSVGCYNHVAGHNLDVIGGGHGVTATSLHPGGVNLSFGDGHGTFVSDSIDLSVCAPSAVGTGMK